MYKEEFFTITDNGEKTKYREEHREEMQYIYMNLVLESEGKTRERYMNIYVGLFLGDSDIRDIK